MREGSPFPAIIRPAYLSLSFSTPRELINCACARRSDTVRDAHFVIPPFQLGWPRPLSPRRSGQGAPRSEAPMNISTRGGGGDRDTPGFEGFKKERERRNLGSGESAETRFEFEKEGLSEAGEKRCCAITRGNGAHCFDSDGLCYR